MKHAGAILSLLSANPEGIGVVAISRAIGASLAATKSQLWHLKSFGIVKANRPGRGARWILGSQV